MVNIDIPKDNIIIEDSSLEIKPSQVIQLKFWGFIKQPGKNTYQLSSNLSTEEIDSLILKILKYFKKEKVPILLSPLSDKYISELYKEKSEVNRIRKQAEAYKNGDFDESEFNRFKTFISNHIPRKLKDHQLKASFHHYLIKNAANFSVPGSGKTSVVLTI